MRFRIILVLISTFLVSALIVGTLAAGNVLIKPAKMNVGPPPPSLNAEAVGFTSRSGASIKGWFSAGASGQGAVLLLHGVRSNRLSMAARAKFLNTLGHSVLLIDLQAHGESSGERITFGYKEGLDAESAVQELKSLAPGERVGAIGVSLGAAALVLSRAHESLSAIVLESMYPTIEEAVDDRLRLHFGALAAHFSPLLLWQLKPRLGVSPDELRPIERVGLLQAPVLLVHGKLDQHTTLAEATRIYERIESRKTMYAIDGAAHVDLHQFSGKEYENRVSEAFAALRRDDR